jgi:hypothetical protein
MIVAQTPLLFAPAHFNVLRSRGNQIKLCSVINILCSFPAENSGKGGEMKVTLSKLPPAKREFDDPATDGLWSRVLTAISGSFEEEINLVWKNGGSR